MSQKNRFLILPTYLVILQLLITCLLKFYLHLVPKLELYLHFPNTPSWCGSSLKHRDNFTFNFTFTLATCLLKFHNSHHNRYLILSIYLVILQILLKSTSIPFCCSTSGVQESVTKYLMAVAVTVQCHDVFRRKSVATKRVSK